MRGKGQLCVLFIGQLGITPAHAGKSAGWKSGLSYAEDHPRACGEKVVFDVLIQRIAGSPPRMRGKDTVDTYPPQLDRITPAHAGKSNIVRPFPEATIGSPPRMRGKAFIAYLNSFFLRITPAHAGKSLKSYRPTRIYQDHPRACGEKAKKIP